MSASRLVKNFLSLAFSDFFGRIIGVLITIYIARTLGAAVFGRLSFAQTFVNYFVTLTDFGLVTLAIREIARKLTAASRISSNILYLRGLLGLILTLLLFTTATLLHLSGDQKVLIFIFGLGILPAALDLSFVFSAFQRMEFFALTKFINQLLAAGLILPLLILYQNILVLPIVQLVTGILGSVLAFGFVKRWFVFRFEEFDLGLIKHLIQGALPIGLAALMVQFYYNFDTVLLQFFKGEEVTGWYNASYKVILLLISLLGFFTGTLFPFFSQRHQDAPDSLRLILGKTLRLLGLFIFPVTVGGIVTGEQLITFLYGKDFMPAVSAFQVLIVVPLFAYLNGLISVAFISANRQGQNLQAVTLGASVNLLLNFLLIPRYSLMGAAVATVLAEVVVFLYFWYILRGWFALDFIGLFAKTLVSALAMGVVLSFLPIRNFLLEVFLGGIFYLIFLLLTRGVSSNDWLLVSQLVRDLKNKKGL